MMNSKCDKCVTDRSLCDRCRDNPKYKDYPSRSRFQEYIPTCPYEYDDCIHDPAYIKFHYPEWYKELYGDMTPEEACIKQCCVDSDYCDDYDDEDK